MLTTEGEAAQKVVDNMKQVNKNKRPIITFREIISDWGVGSFFGFFLAYFIFGKESVKTDLVDAFGVQFFAILKGVVLLCGIASGIIGGKRLVIILFELKKRYKIVDTQDMTNEADNNLTP